VVRWRFTDELKNLYYEIQDIHEEVKENLREQFNQPECFYEFKEPISMHAQIKGMSYGKTREFIIAGIIVKEIEIH
jgi:hypothetical protein